MALWASPAGLSRSARQPCECSLHLRTSLNANAQSAHFVLSSSHATASRFAAELLSLYSLLPLSRVSASTPCSLPQVALTDPATLPCLLMTRTTQRERPSTFPLAVVCDPAPLPCKFRNASNTMPCGVQLQSVLNKALQPTCVDVSSGCAHDCEGSVNKTKTFENTCCRRHRLEGRELGLGGSYQRKTGHHFRGCSTIQRVRIGET